MIYLRFKMYNFAYKLYQIITYYLKACHMSNRIVFNANIK